MEVDPHDSLTFWEVKAVFLVALNFVMLPASGYRFTGSDRR
jgi:hypothetical protein